LDAKAYRDRRDFLIDTFEIAEYMRTPVRKLSLGERMRCELAAALLHKPELVFLDEPTIGLDVIARQRIRDLIGYLNAEEGLTVFLTSHDAGDIEQVCKRTLVINHGEIVLDASVSHLKREYLRVKTVDLLLEGNAEQLIASGESVEQKQLKFLTEEQAREVRVLKAQGHTLKLEINTAGGSLEKVISALMGQGHILDMTISDPPMEEIISKIYRQVARAEVPAEGQSVEV
jgi:ABC-2 type transport system ATP-binding protein